MKTILDKMTEKGLDPLLPLIGVPMPLLKAMR